MNQKVFVNIFHRNNSKTFVFPLFFFNAENEKAQKKKMLWENLN